MPQFRALPTLTLVTIQPCQIAHPTLPIWWQTKSVEQRKEKREESQTPPVCASRTKSKRRARKRIAPQIARPQQEARERKRRVARAQRTTAQRSRAFGPRTRGVSRRRRRAGLSL